MEEKETLPPDFEPVKYYESEKINSIYEIYKSPDWEKTIPELLETVEKYQSGKETENSFIDLKTYDPDLYKSLVTLKTYEGDVKNDLGLYFSLTIEKNGKNVTFELIDGGNNIPVTNENRLTYIKKVTDYYLTFQFKEAVENFRNGMSKVMNMDILRLYSGEELRQIIYGFDKDVFTVTDMEKMLLLN